MLDETYIEDVLFIKFPAKDGVADTPLQFATPIEADILANPPSLNMELFIYMLLTVLEPNCACITAAIFLPISMYVIY